MAGEAQRCVDSIDVGKRRIRHDIAVLRKGHDAAWYKTWSEAVQRRCIELSEFKSASHVCSYLALPAEVDTELIIRECWKNGKDVCVPAFRIETGQYEPAIYMKATELKPGPLKVLEPVSPEWVDIREVDLMAVPGVAFDESCMRLGHGGGHYDGMLGEWGKAAGGLRFKVGLAFEFQIFGEIPVSGRDVGMDAVVTEKRVLRRGMSEAR